MDKSKAALGSEAASSVGMCLAIDSETLPPQDRILLLEEQMRHMQKVIMRLKKGSVGAQVPAQPAENANKDGIPIGTICIGATEKSPFLFYLTVGVDDYTVGLTKYGSLSAAAEAVSKVRRSGWTFWRLVDGRTLKEVYRT